MRRLFIILFILLFLTSCGESDTFEDYDYEYHAPEIVDPIIEYDCLFGKLNYLNQCVDTMSFPAMIGYECPSGYSGGGPSCTKIGGMYTLNCGPGKVEVNGVCYQQYKNARQYYYCTSGELRGRECVQENIFTPNIKYKCEDGFYLNIYNKCQKDW